MNGKVKFFNDTKGFGFIIGEDDKDYFVHRSDVGEDQPLDKDVKVSFDPTEGEKGMRAENVKVIQ